MLKDLFFSIWFDQSGNGWRLFIIVLFLLSLAILVFNFALIKAKNSKFSKKHFIGLVFIILIMYQMIPVSLDFLTNIIFDKKLAINIEKIAIKTSLIPWQKGGYYCLLADLYFLDRNYTKMYEAYDSAYKYLKGYDNPCWGISFLHFEINGDYDRAIEIAKNWRGKDNDVPYEFIAICYIMKNDMKNAEFYINKDIQQKEVPSNIATKAYILKMNGKIDESLRYYKKAKEMYGKDIVEQRYTNFVEYEKKRIDLIKKRRAEAGE